jgi:C-terminal processing protease CtpA/Prc
VVTLSFLQPIPPTTQWRYRGRTVMLIDERTISQAEHTGLFFEAANNTTFVGSPTRGANGDVTNFWVPGGISIGFSGHDVRHADGRQLQRVGLVPHVEVKPTIAGLRAGRDEVLERALAVLAGQVP